MEVNNASGMKAQTVDQQVMSIVNTVLERCKKEKSNNYLQVPLEDCYERVSFYTGLPKMFVYHVIDNNQHEDNFSDNDHIILMKCINKFLSDNFFPKVMDLYCDFLKCRETLNPLAKCTPDIKTFEGKLYSYGYTYKKNLKSPPFILMEDPKQKFCRFNYLFKIKNFREKNLKIYYVDEKQISLPPFKKPDVDQSGKCKREALIFFHIISADGYENGIFVSLDGDQTLKDIFKKWMLDLVLYTIKPGSVIVMANNPIHGELLRNSITRYHSKKQILQWLRKNNIPCDTSMNKPRLYDLVEKCTYNSKDYDIDRVFKLNGHHVLRLPDNFPSLSPTTFLWDYINIGILQNKNVERMRNILLSYIIDLSKNKSEQWLSFFDSASTMESQIFEIDLTTEELLENNCELDEKYFYEPSTSCSINYFAEL